MSTITCAYPFIFYGETTIISVENITNIQFTPLDSVVSILGTNYTVKPLQTTLYSVSGYDLSYQYIQINLTIYVNVTILPDPTNLVSYQLTKIQTITVPYQTSIVIQAYGVASYQWYPSTYLNNTNTSTVVCTPLANITSFLPSS